MPHYKDGRLARVGDLVIHIDLHDSGNEKILIVQSIIPNLESCNANAIPLAIRQRGTEQWFPWPNQLQWSLTLKECYKIRELGDPKPQEMYSDESTRPDVTLVGSAAPSG